MRTHGTHILIVDDDEGVRHLLRATLSREGHDTIQASDGLEAIRFIQSEMLNLVILDIMMPKMDGLEVLRFVRQWSQMPVIVLSARGSTADKKECLDLGADDYMTKPFAVEEMLARVRAHLRRTTFMNSAPPAPLFTCGDLQFDFVRRSIAIEGREVKTTPTEYGLLQELVINAGKVLTYRYLLNKVWGPEYGSEREYLHVYIGYLRAKLETDPRHPDYIITIPGVGYKFNHAE